MVAKPRNIDCVSFLCLARPSSKLGSSREENGCAISASVGMALAGDGTDRGFALADRDDALSPEQEEESDERGGDERERHEGESHADGRQDDRREEVGHVRAVGLETHEEDEPADEV